MTNVNILTIKSLPEKCPLSGQTTISTIQIDPARRYATIYQDWPGDNTQTFDAYHGLVIDRRIGQSDFTPDGYEYPRSGESHAEPVRFRTFLEGKDGQELLTTICDNHSVEWDGHNNRGTLNDAGHLALMTLMDALDTVTGGIEAWDVGDWLEMADSDSLGITPTTTPDELREITSTIVADAKAEGVHLLGDLTAYLEQRQADLTDN